MTIRVFAVLFSICAATAVYGQQPGAIAGPLSGFVFDNSAQALRPVRGIPGASTIGDPVNAGLALASATLSPLQDSAFARGADGSVHYFVINGGSVAEQVIDGLGGVERVAFSPSGKSAAIYAAGTVQLVTGLPGAPVVAGNLPLGAGGRNRLALTSFAVSDDGAYVLLAAGESVQLFSLSAGSRTVISPGIGASVAFAPGSHDAAVAVRGTGVVLIQDVGGAASQRVLAPDNVPDDLSFTAIGGVAFSGDGQKLFMTSIAAQSVVGFDVAAGQRSDLPCGCAPTGLTRMNNQFRLTELGSGPLWMLDGGAAPPRIVFVPALKGNS